MIINFESDFDRLRKHLKDEYSLGCKFEKSKANIQKKYKKKDFEITNNTSISELNIYLTDIWLKTITVFNSDGNKIPPELTFEEAKSFKVEFNESYNFNNLLNSLNSISRSSDYADIEWIKRMGAKALKISLNKAEKSKVLLVLEEILENNQKFLQSDLDEILKK